MSTPTRVAVPAGRYGADPAQANRRWRRAYVAFAVLFVLLVAAVSTAYEMQSQGVSGEIVSFQVVSASEVQMHLEVSKSGGSSASCTVRSRDINGNEVGRLTVAVPKAVSSYDTIVSLRTSGRGTTGELVSCS